jgi:hypothetical protein
MPSRQGGNLVAPSGTLIPAQFREESEMRFIDHLRRGVTTCAVTGVALTAAMLISAGRAEAAPLNLNSIPPEIFTAPLAVTYSGGVLTATLSGGIGTYSPGGVQVQNVDYLLTANVDAAGVMSNGTLSITGAVSGLGVPQSTLLAGNLTDFGFYQDQGFTLLEFEFDTTDPGAVPLGFGSEGGVILSSFDMGPLNFAGSFQGSAESDTYTTAAPEPAMLSLLALGAAGMARRRRIARSRN